MLAASTALIFVLNALSVVLFPAIGHMLDVDPHEFFVFIGVSVHDVAGVAAAAAAFDPSSVDVALTTKLSRVVWIVPLAFAAAAAFRTTGRVAIPWFILWFFVAAWIASQVSGWIPRWDVVAAGSKTFFGPALFLIGSSASMAEMRELGFRPVLFALSLWGLVVVAATLWLSLGGPG